MNVLRFLAADAADALDQIRSRLGPEAIVISVKQAPIEGLGRLWRKPRLEVLACLPEPPPAAEASPEPAAPETGLATAPAAVLEEQGGGSLASRWVSPAIPDPALGPAGLADAPMVPPGLAGAWRSGAVLHQMGLQPLLIERVLDRARSTHGDTPPGVFAEEVALVRAALASFWRPPAVLFNGAPAVHVFLGPPGSGKTTALCKWLAKAVLTEGRKARAWRLDGRAANVSGLLDLYGEILGVPVGRAWQGPKEMADADIGFVDLPGVNPQDASALGQLRAAIAAIPGTQVHLVLNAAYDSSVLLALARGFSSLPVHDLILTHLDEEKRRGKLWNFVVGTNFTLRCLCGGQNIPGDFSLATPELLLGR